MFDEFKEKLVKMHWDFNIDALLFSIIFFTIGVILGVLL